MNSPRIVFGVLSSRDTAQAITSLADILYPHQIIVHHDFTKFADFKIERSNVIVLADPVVTGWGGWSLVEATLKLMQAAKEQFDFDYFQLLSETCLPVKPIREFESYLTKNSPDAMIDLQPILSSADPAFLSHGWRYYPKTKFWCNLARKIIYLSRDCFTWQQRGLINLKVLKKDLSLMERLQSIFVKACYQLWWYFGSFPLSGVKTCAVGGQWFSLSAGLLDKVLDFIVINPEFVNHYKQVHIPDESFFQTIIYALRPDQVLPANHVLFWHSNANGPDVITLNDLDSLGSASFFARKFTLDAADPARMLILDSLWNNS